MKKNPVQLNTYYYRQIDNENTRKTINTNLKNNVNA